MEWFSAEEASKGRKQGISCGLMSREQRKEKRERGFWTKVEIQSKDLYKGRPENMIIILLNIKEEEEEKKVKKSYTFDREEEEAIAVTCHQKAKV